MVKRTKLALSFLEDCLALVSKVVHGLANLLRQPLAILGEPIIL